MLLTLFYLFSFKAFYCKIKCRAITPVSSRVQLYRLQYGYCRRKQTTTESTLLLHTHTHTHTHTYIIAIIIIVSNTKRCISGFCSIMMSFEQNYTFMQVGAVILPYIYIYIYIYIYYKHTQTHKHTFMRLKKPIINRNLVYANFVVFSNNTEVCVNELFITAVSAISLSSSSSSSSSS